MPWGRLDDRGNRNSKLLALSDPAWRMWGCALIYCQDELTDGFIPDAAIFTFGVKAKNKAALADELCRSLVPGKGPLWHKVDGGYRVHDYLDWNESRDKVLAERAKTKARVEKFRHGRSSGVETKDVTALPTLLPQPLPQPQEIKNPSDSSAGNRKRLGPTASDLVEIWNELTTSPIPKVTKLTADRRAKLDARLKTYPDLTVWRTVITWINGQAWMRASGAGEHPNWTATLDWLCKNDGQVQRYIERAMTASSGRMNAAPADRFAQAADRRNAQLFAKGGTE